MKLAKQTIKGQESSSTGQLEKGAAFVLHLAVSAAMLLVIAVLPFYYTNGYARIGSDKYDFLAKMSRLLMPVFAVLLLVWIGIVIYRLWKERRQYQLSLSVTDLCMLAYLAAVLLSFLGTAYPETARYGSNEWHMGFATQLGLIAGYFLISHFWKKNNWMPALFLPVSAVVFLLGLLNRFGVYPVKMVSQRPDFISTIGNINWYCGYLVTVLFGAVYLLWREEITKKWLRYGLTAYVALGFATLVTQGSSSGVFTLVILLLCLFFASVKSVERLSRFFELTLLLSIVCLALLLLRLLAPDAVTYIEGTTDLFTLSPFPVLMAVVSGAARWQLYYCGCRRGSVGGRGMSGRKLLLSPELFWQKAGRLLAYGIGAVLLLYLLLTTANTLKPGLLGPLSDSLAFTFGPEWGSKRGATWGAGVMCFLEQDFWGKLTGVGPDCMASYIATDGSDTLQQLVFTQFNGATLTNAHNEWITVLVNTGVLGLISYGALIVTALLRFLKKGGLAGALGFCILAYTVNNIFSFQQAVNTPTMFVLLGMGEAFLRRREQEKQAE